MSDQEWNENWEQVFTGIFKSRDAQEASWFENQPEEIKLRVEAYERTTGYKLTPWQREYAAAFLENRDLPATGGRGMGKSFVQEFIRKMIEAERGT